MPRLLALAILGQLSGISAAQWTVQVLHPEGKEESMVYNASGATQTGYTVIDGAYHASVWSGTSGSWVDLHPAEASFSIANGRSGNQQFGYIHLSGSIYYASGWQGSPESWFSLHPPHAGASVIHGASATQQVGYAYFDNKYQAALWRGTAESWTNLHIASATLSIALGAFENSSLSVQVGYANVAGVERACLWYSTPESWTNLHPLGAIGSVAYGVFGGTQVGSVTFNQAEFATLWNGTPESAINLNPASSSYSVAYNVLGDTEVGYSTFDGLKRAGYWRGSASSWTDLHAFLPTNYSFSVARSITSDGAYDYIGGYARNTTTNKTEAVLWKRATVLSDLFALTLNKQTVAGQNSVQGTITVSLSSPFARTYSTYDNSSLVNTPPSVTLPAGEQVKNFQITVTSVNSPINTTIYARRGAIVQSQPLTLAPLVPTALSFTPNPVSGGQSTLGRVVVNGVAGPEGRTIALFDNSAFSTTPSSVTVPPGGSSATFTITTRPVTAVQTVTVTARVSAGEKTGTFRINP